MTKIFKADFSRKFYVPAEYDVLVLFSPKEVSKEPVFEFRYRTQYLTELPKDLETTSQVVERIPVPSSIEESEQLPSAISKITAKSMPSIKVNWDGEPVETKTLEGIITASAFSHISFLLICMIVVVCLVIAYINRRLLIDKWRANCARKTIEAKKPCHHDESMVAASASIKKF